MPGRPELVTYITKQARSLPRGQEDFLSGDALLVVDLFNQVFDDLLQVGLDLFDVFHALQCQQFAFVFEFAAEQFFRVGRVGAPQEDQADGILFVKVEAHDIAFVFLRIEGFHLARVIKRGCVPIDAFTHRFVGAEDQLPQLVDHIKQGVPEFFQVGIHDPGFGDAGGEVVLFFHNHPFYRSAMMRWGRRCPASLSERNSISCQ